MPLNASLVQVCTGNHHVNEELLWKAATSEDRSAKAHVLAFIERLFQDVHGFFSNGDAKINVNLAAVHIALSRLCTEQGKLLVEEEAQQMGSKARMAARQACYLVGVRNDLRSEAQSILTTLETWGGMQRVVASCALMQFALCCGALQPRVTRDRCTETEGRTCGLFEVEFDALSERETETESTLEMFQAYAVYLACLIQASGTGIGGLNMSGPLGLLVHATSKGHIWQGDDRDMVLDFVERMTRSCR
jgi:hypothetical protein